jgi:hypothetical protein
MNLVKHENHLIRLQRLGYNKSWLALQTGLQLSAVSMWLKGWGKKDIGDKIEKALTEEENKKSK